jgi:hypothetical protein
LRSAVALARFACRQGAAVLARHGYHMHGRVARRKRKG